MNGFLLANRMRSDWGYLVMWRSYVHRRLRHQDGCRGDDQSRLLGNWLIIPRAVSAWAEPPSLTKTFEGSMLTSARRRREKHPSAMSVHAPSRPYASR